MVEHIEKTMEDTFPSLLMRNYRKYGDRKIAMRKKDFGIWHEYTWKDCYEKVKYFSLGLISLGFEPEDKLAILGDNDPEWYWAEFAAQAAGGLAVGMFIDMTSPEVKYIVEHSESRFMAAKDQEQVDKALAIKDDLPKLKKVIYWDPKGLRGYADPILTSFDQVIELGVEYEKAHPGLFEENVARCRSEDPCCICYTSGTTGEHGKGAVMSYRALMFTMSRTLKICPMDDSWDYVSYTSPSWGVEQIFGIADQLLTGFVVDFPEKPETVTEDIREIGARFLIFASRLWESIASTVQAKITDTSALKRFMYNLALPIGYKMADLRLEGEKANLLWRALYGLADLMVLRPLRDKHGLLKTRLAYTMGSALGPNAFRFFHALGVNLRQIYGCTEQGTATIHSNDIKFDTVGSVVADTEVRLKDDGEILIRGKGGFSGYYRDPVATAKVLDEQKWTHTGDAGHFEESGQLIYLDRLVDMDELAGGAKFSPQYIEVRLKFSPYIRDVMVVGGGDKPYVAALVNIDYDNVGKWAERRRIPYTTFADLSQKPEVYDLIRKDIQRINRTLPEPARVRKYVLLNKELDPDEAELTRTRKLRRAFVASRYGDLVTAVYDDKCDVDLEAQVKYRDGRVRTTKTTIKIVSVE